MLTLTPSQLALSSLASPRNKLVTKQINQLTQKRLALQYKLKEIQARVVLKDSLERELAVNQKCLHVIDRDMSKLSEFLTGLGERLQGLKRERVELVVGYQDTQMMAQVLRKECIQLFRYQENPLEKIRMQMIQLQTSQPILAIQDQFSLRKCIIGFLKGKVRSSQVFEQGVELAIAQKRLTACFRNYLTKIVQEKITIQNDQARDVIKEYLGLLERAQSIIQQRFGTNLDFKEEKQQAQQLRNSKIQALNECRKQLRTLQQRINSNNQQLTKIQLTINQYCILVQNRQKDKINIHSTLAKLQQRLYQLNQLQQQRRNMFSQLMEITQAIQYLSAKQISNQNNINSTNSMQSHMDLHLKSYQGMEAQTSINLQSSTSINLQLSGCMAQSGSKISRFKSNRKTKVGMESSKQKRSILMSPHWK